MRRFEDMTLEESLPLMEYLYAHSTRPDRIYRHHWTEGDVVMWDNRCTMHRVTPYDLSLRRIMHRAAVMGDGPVIGV